MIVGLEQGIKLVFSVLKDWILYGHFLKESAVFKGGFYQGSNVLVLHFFMGTFKGVFCSHLFHNVIIGVFNQWLDNG